MARRQARWADCFRLIASMFVMVLVVSLSQTAHADGPMGRNFGLGFAAGNPSSFTGKYYFGGGSEAFDFHIGVYKAYNRGFYDDTLFLAGDYLFEVWNFVENSDISLPFYAGPGAAMLLDLDDECWIDDGRRRCRNDFDFGIGPRMPIGIAAQFQKAPFELFLEMSPTLLFIVRDDAYGDDLDVDIDIVNFAFGGRFYF